MITTIAEYQQRIEERDLIKKETKSANIYGLAVMIFSILCGVAAYLLKIKQTMTTEKQDNLYQVVSLAVVMVFVVILAVRKTIYYSPRLIKKEFTVTQVLQKWRVIDFILITIAGLIPVCGLVLTFIGMPFDRTFHLYLGPAILLLMLMPMTIKVRSKLSLLRKYFPDI